MYEFCCENPRVEMATKLVSTLIDWLDSILCDIRSLIDFVDYVFSRRFNYTLPSCRPPSCMCTHHSTTSILEEQGLALFGSLTNCSHVIDENFITHSNCGAFSLSSYLIIISPLRRSREMHRARSTFPINANEKTENFHPLDSFDSLQTLEKHWENVIFLSLIYSRVFIVVCYF